MFEGSPAVGREVGTLDVVFVDAGWEFHLPRDQCIMRERPASEGRSRMEHRLRSTALCRLRSATAALGVSVRENRRRG
jgi:hypothetical protein